MNILLSCGPILEPLIGAISSLVFSIILFIYIIKRAKKSEFYKNEFSESTLLKKMTYVLLFTTAVISFLVLLFFILTFVIAGIIIELKKN